jgi:hypothetical protein
VRHSVWTVGPDGAGDWGAWEGGAGAKTSARACAGCRHRAAAGVLLWGGDWHEQREADQWQNAVAWRDDEGSERRRSGRAGATLQQR